MWELMSGVTAATGTHEEKTCEEKPTENPANQSWNSPAWHFLVLRFDSMSLLFQAWKMASLGQEENRNEP